MVLYLQMKHTIVIYYLYIVIKITNAFKVWLYSTSYYPQTKAFIVMLEYLKRGEEDWNPSST